MPELTVSIVIWRSDPVLLSRTLETLSRAIERSGRSARCELIDNDCGPLPGRMPAGLHLRRGHGNVGFGRGHNLAIADAQSRWHLILNPDVELAAEALAAAIDFLDKHPECGLLAPWVVNVKNEPEYLCKRYPALIDLLIRGFAPFWLRRCFTARLASYELRDRPAEDVLWDPPIISGCFMLFRTDVLQSLGGFDPRYFLYFEDFDLSLRAARVTRIARVPTVRIVHHGGHAARKGWRHIRLFARSALTFFNTHGWKMW